MFFNQILHSRKNVCYAYFIILLFAPFFSVLAQAPTISGFTPSSGPIGSLVTITGTNLSNPTVFSIGGTSALVISNTGTSLVGFVMPGATTGNISLTTAGGSVSSGSNFTVSAPQAITTQIGDKVSGNDNIGVAFQGLPVALSANGNTAIIGGNDDNAGQGAAWVFTKVNGFWSQQGAKLVGTGNIGAASQGISVALSADGNTAAIGGGNDDFGKGAIWIFTRTGSTWTQQGPKLSVTGNTNAAAAGSTLSLSADGNTLLTGAPTENIGVGAGWIFTRSGGVWTQQAKLSGSGTIGQSQIGFSVSLSADGNTAALGGLEDFSGMGAVWVFTRSGTVWSQQGSKLVGTGNIGNAKQGSSIALNANGNFLIVGAGYDDNQKGAAWVFTRSGSTWNQQNKLFGAGASAPSRQGSSVSLNADGSRAAVGGYLDNFGTGSVWLFNRSGSTWSQTLKTAGSGASGSSAQGISLNLSADGQTLGIGGPGDNFNNGATWFFGPIPSAPTITSFTPTTGSDGVVVTLTGTNFTGATSVSFGGTPAQEFTVVNGTTISAMVAAGTSGSVSVTTPGGTGTLPGFTYIFSATPTITSFSPSIGYIGSLVTITGTNLLNPSIFTIGGTPALIISNTTTKLVGMVMPGSVTGLINITTTGGNVTSSGSITINPSLNLSAQQGDKLVGSGSTGPGQQGYSVALSADGNTAIVGAPNDNGNKGAAWIYVRTGSNWTQQGSKLTGFGATGNAEQGVSVAISADGNTALVGGWKDDISTGAAWVFTRTGTTWTQQGGKLIGSLNNGASQQGYSVALSADGNTAVLGGQGDNGSNGAIWIFTRSSGVWSQQGSKITVSDNIGVAQLGHSVALSADGNTLAAGGFSDDSDEGASWIFTRSGSVWSQQAKLKGTSSSFSNQGQSVAINANGNTVLIGGNFDNTGAGAAWVFARTGSTWTQQGGKLTPGGATGPAFFGQSVALSADGNTASIGGENDNSGRGAGWVFKRTGSTWAQSGSKLVGTGFIGNGKQGWATAVSADANTLMMGGNQDNSNRGAVWVFSQAGPPTITSFTPVQAGVGTTVEIYGANFLGATAVSFGGTPAASFFVVNNTTIQAVVAGGATGVVSVTTSGGTAGLAGFTFVLPPTITSFTPTSAGSGTSVTISGTNFSTATSVNFGGLAAASFNIINNTTITAIVGSGNSGSVSITNPGGTGSLGGFTFNAGATPTIISFSPSSGSVGTLVTITGTNLANTTAFTMGGISAISVSNNGTTLVGMVMPGAATGTISITTSGGTVLSTSNFTVTPTPFPNIQQGSKLVATGNSGAANQGNSVAVSADGNTAIVGGYLDNTNQGAVWVYTRSGTTWVQQGSKLVGTGNIGAANQGRSVALSADGNTAIVGGNSDNTNQGAVWVYTRSGSTWSQQGSKLVGAGNSGAARQGHSVALSADGNTAIVGGWEDNSNQGAVWVFTRSSSIWTQQGSKLVGTGITGIAQQGFSVSLSADGNTAMVGGPGDNSNQGAAWVYTRSASTWTQQGSKLVGAGNVGAAAQGTSVALSADGSTAIVGGRTDNTLQGAAWVYSRSGSTWTQQGSKLVGTGNLAASHGYSVSLSADGNTAIVGGRGDNSSQGAAWVYIRSGSTWSQQGSKLVGTGSTGFSVFQGNSVSLSADGNTGIIGGPLDNTGQGATWVFVNITPPPTITSFSPSSGSVGTLVTITGTNLANTTTFNIGGVSAIGISNNGTALVGMVMPGAATGAISITTVGGTVLSTSNFTVTPTPFPNAQQGSKLVGTGNTGGARQGRSIAVSANGNTAIVGGDFDNGGQGAAWVYTRSGTTWTQQGSKLVGTGNTGTASQGVSVALSADGNTAILGGFSDNSQQGAAWVFTRSGITWTQQGSKLVGTGNIGAAQQGVSVALSADGNTAIVGGYADNTNQGAVWVYTRSGSTWTQQGSKLVGTGRIGAAYQGFSVAVSADGNTAVVGGYADNTNQGAVWVFTRSGSTWSQQGSKLVGTGNIGAANQGYSVALSADGNTAVVGGYLDNTNQGAVWVYTRSGTTWTQQGSKLVGTGNIGGANQGHSVALSADGNTAIFGGIIDNSLQGAAWVYTRSGSTWSQQGAKLVGTGNTGAAFQGVSIALSADGNFGMVGGAQDNSSQGAAWVFVNTPPPTITSFSPSSGSVGTLVTITGTNLANTTAFNIGGVSAISVSNNGTTLVGMVMPGAATGTISITTAGGTVLSAGNFTVTPTPFPNTQQGSKLVGTGNTGAASQGLSIALSADGNTAIVGGYADNTNRGAAWVYTRSGTTWTQQGSKLVGIGNIGAAQQGISVALSADGNTAILGGWEDNSNQGAVWVFTRSGSTWSQQGSKLVGTGNSGAARQGYSIALSADGNTAIVGGYTDNLGQGAIWVYTRSGTTWSQQGSKLVGTGNAGIAQQGFSVSLSADGNTAIVGGPGDNSGQGATWVYTRTGTTWTQQGSKLVGTGNTGAAGQGRSIALAADGNTAIWGGRWDDSNQGAAWVFTRSGSTWTQQGSKLLGTGAVGIAGQGQSVALSADGNTAMVGAIQENFGQGAAWVFTRSGNTWTQQGSKLVGTGNSGAASQGVSVALSADGNFGMVGGAQDNSSQGAAWVFVNTPPPTITSFSPSSGSVGTLVTITGTNLANTTAFSIGGVSAISVSNNGTTLVGMVMPGAATGTISITTAGGTILSTSNFTVTPTPFPNAQQGSKLVGTGNTGAASQGQSIAVSADGNTAIVGGPFDNSTEGAVWVYTRSGSTWTQQGSKLVGTGNIGSAQQGMSVALSADGNTAIIGGGLDNTNQGAVWVFTRSGTTWTQQGSKLVGTGNSGGAQQGISVALSADGNTAIVGGSRDNTNQGAAWIYTRSGTTWSQQGSKLVGTGVVNIAQQGISVALSADGNTAIVGGFSDNGQGAVWVYTRSGSTWTQQGSKLVGTGNSGGARQGASVALSADGNTAVVGGYSDNTDQGAVWVYTRSGGIWTQQGSKLVGTGNTGPARQGGSVAVSADGNTLIVGGSIDNSAQGAVWVFIRSGITWNQQGSKLVGTGNIGSAFQGTDVALSADGNTAIVGGEPDNSSQGAAWVFVYVAPPPTITSFSPSSGSVGTLVTITGTNLANTTAFTIGGVSAISVSNNGTTLVGMVMPGASTGTISITTAGGTVLSAGNFTVTPTPFPNSQQGSKLVGTGNIGAASQGRSLALSADGNTAIVGGPADNTNQGAVWVYTRSETTWTQQGSKLVGTGNIGAAQQGYSVALSADGNTAIVGGYSDNTDQGAVWVFTRSGTTWTQQGAKLVGTGNSGAARQGYSVALSADGNTAIVGGYADNSVQGAAWVFTRSGTTWAQQGSKLVGTGTVGIAQQGNSVGLSADGNTAIVGGTQDNSFQGAVWVYTRSGTTWTQQGSKLVGTGAVGLAQQGNSVALSADGRTAIVGGYSDNTNQGAVWVYTRSGGIWTQQGSKLVGTGNSGAAQQGRSVALSADGNTAIVGGWQDNSFQGAGWVYTRSGSTWAQQGSKLVGTGNSGGASQGWSIAISADGNTGMVGGILDNSNQGANWVFVNTTAPTITSFSPSSGSVGTLVTINGINMANLTSLMVGGVNAIVVSNDGSKLVAMVMPGSTTGQISLTTIGGSTTTGAIFTVTKTPFPNIQQGSKIVGTGGVGSSLQGSTVSISADGNTAIVGGRGDNGGIGAAWIYTRSGALWTQQGSKLIGTGATGIANQGSSVCLSADGNTALIGGSRDDNFVGAVWIFTRNGTVWTQQGNKLVGTGAVGTSFQGVSASLSADGNTAIVGGRGDNNTAGAVWIYTRTGGVWTQQGNKLVGTGSVGDALQGNSVSLSADGNTAIVGGHADNSNVGASWIYTRSGSVWTQQGNKLVGTGAVGAARLGFSVSISADGNTAIAGGFGDNSNVGAGWVFTRSGGVWSQQGSKLTGTGFVGFSFQGHSVSLSADGNTAVLGGYNDDVAVGNGAVWVFTRNVGTWSQQGNKLVGSGAAGASEQGSSVYISADGNTAIVGGNRDNSFIGGSWIYTIGSTTITSFTPTSASVGQTITITGTNFSGVTSVSLGGVSASSFVVVNPTTITAVVDSGASGSVSVSTSGGTVSLSGFTFISAPIITSYTPTASGTGLTITINGFNFPGATAVSFGGTAATSFNVVNSNTITAIVASGASGSVSVTTPGGTASLVGFTFIPAPTISSFTPTSAATGTTVTITGSNLIGASSVSFGGTAATSFSVVNSTTITAVVASGTSGSVTVTTPGGIASLSGFTFIPVPTITSFTPTSAGTGATVTISGTNFTGASAVSFGGAAATSYSVVNSTTITAVVASGTSGSVSVITPGGTASLAGFTFVPAPTVSSFTPTSAVAGATVTLTGTNFTGASSVSFGGTAAASFNVVNSTTITAVVASGTTGSVSVTTPGGTASLAGFTFIPEPTISSFTPTSAGTGATVTLTGTNFNGATSVTFGGTAATSYSVVNSTTITAVVALGTSGSVSVTTLGGTASLAGFTFIPEPTISSFTPTSAGTGATVTLTGTNFNGATSVTFGGTAATSYSVVNSTTITAVVASGTSGSVSVITPGGTASLAGFTFVPAPTVSSFTPTSAVAGATVTLTGTNFTGASSVSFGGTAAASFNVVNSTTITAVVASGTTGSVSVTTPGGTASLAGFTFIPAPTISSFTPTSAGTGATVTVSGTNFTGASAISFGGTAATSFNVVDATTITAVIASGTSGSVSVTAPGGTASLAGFTFIPAPTLSSFTPTSAGSGATVTLTGTNFNGATSVTFGGTAATSFSVVNSTTITAVVAAGTTGSVSVITPGGTTSLAGFTFFVAPSAPTITSFTPTSAGTGTTVTLTGTNYTGASAVSFGGTAATSFSVVNATTITAVVATGTSGSVSVTTPGGTASLAGFTFISSPLFNTWTGTGNWNTPANWSFGTVPLTTESVIVASGTVMVNGNISIQNLTVNGGATISINNGLLLTISANNVTIQGQVEGPGLLEIAGTNPAITSGPAGSVENIRINTLGGTANLQNPFRLTGTLKLQSGILQTNGNLILVSNASGTARISKIEEGNGADIVGDVIWQRHVPGPAGWRFIGTPIQNQTLATWTDDFGIYSNSFFVHNEGGTLNSGSQVNGWENGANGGVVGKGYRAFMNSAFMSGTAVIDNTGPITKGLFPFSLSFTPAGYGGGGWNFLANPYPCEVDWHSFTRSAEVDGAIHIFNKTQYGSYSAGSMISVNGVSGYIRQGQGFFVKTTSNAATMSVTEDAKPATNQATGFLRTATSTDPVLKFFLQTQNGEKDEMAIAFREDATAGYDKELDAHKFDGLLALSAKSSGNLALSIQCLALNADQTTVVPLQFRVPEAGTYSIRYQLERGEAHYQLWLKDLENGTLTPFENGETINFTTSTTFANQRFELVVMPETTTAANGVQKSQILVYPNPAKDQIHVQSTDQTIGNIEIFNPLGMKMYSSGNQAIGNTILHVKDYPKGLYLIRINSIKGIQETKILIQ